MIVPKNIPTRRTVLKLAGLTGAAALLGGIQGCKKAEATSSDDSKMKAATAGGTGASDGPETTKISFGMIALTDCSPIVIAAEKGLFKKYGIDATVAKQGNWKAVNEGIVGGNIQATHMLIGMPIASTMGLGGNAVPMVIPWILNRNGQSISLQKNLNGKVQADAKALKPIVDAAKAGGKPMKFAMTFPYGTHNMWIRYWLGAGGINPDKDCDLKVIPPANMFTGMQSGDVDGFCVGEPWNAKTVAEKIGFTAINTQDIWKDHPEKVLGMRADFAEKNPKTVKAMLKALHEASVWLDNLDNRPEQCQIISKTNYVNTPPENILSRMQGKYDFGDGRTKQDPNYMIFSSRNCNYPQLKYATWFMAQFRRWGIISGTPDYDGVTKKVMRSDLYEEAMKEISYSHGGPDAKPETLFDNITFDPAKPEEYAKGFEVHSMKG
jgi:nitrate/nitrite transport system substrate-binding protein